MTRYALPLLLCFFAAIKPLAAGIIDFQSLEDRAATLARSPFAPLERTVPEEAATMSYATYQAIRFNKEKALWADTTLPFRLEMFYRAFLFPERIRINLVDLNGNVREVPFSPDMYQVTPKELGKLPEVPPNYGFSGLKIFYDFPPPRNWEEMMIFQGASYFRIPAKGQHFGLSARGIAVNTASKAADEEFPAFTEFWVYEPKPGQKEITALGLLDGPTVTGAYEFIARPGDSTTTVDVKASLYFRKTASRIGYAPLTSMFWFGENNYRRFSDYRPEVHDSDGLLIVTKEGLRMWRPLQTVKKHLVDEYRLPQAPRGFGLLQRDRAFSNHVDIEAKYHRRPSLWIIPDEEWNEGSVVLWQIPTEDEYHDNIVAYWMPDKVPAAGERRMLHYQLLSTTEEPPNLPSSGQVTATYIMSSYGRKDRYLIMVDFAWGGPQPPPPFPAGELPKMELEAEKAEILSQYIVPNPDGQTWRLHTVIQFPSPDMKSPLRFRLTGPKGWKSEEWLYTFVPQE